MNEEQTQEQLQSPEPDDEPREELSEAEAEEILQRLREAGTTRMTAEDGEGGEEEDEDASKIQVGLTPMGVSVRVLGRDGNSATTYLSPDECFTIAGHINALASVLIGMNIQQQMAQQAQIERLLAQQAKGERRSPGGLVLP